MREVQTHNYEWALQALEQGLSVARLSWENNDFLSLVYVLTEEQEKAAEAAIEQGKEPLEVLNEDELITSIAFFVEDDMESSVPTWAPSLNDEKADDWIRVYVDNEAVEEEVQDEVVSENEPA